MQTNVVLCERGMLAADIAAAGACQGMITRSADAPLLRGLHSWIGSELARYPRALDTGALCTHSAGLGHFVVYTQNSSTTWIYTAGSVSAELADGYGFDAWVMAHAVGRVPVLAMPPHVLSAAGASSIEQLVGAVRAHAPDGELVSRAPDGGRVQIWGAGPQHEKVPWEYGILLHPIGADQVQDMRKEVFVGTEWEVAYQLREACPALLPSDIGQLALDEGLAAAVTTSTAATPPGPKLAGNGAVSP